MQLILGSPQFWALKVLLSSAYSCVRCTPAVLSSCAALHPVEQLELCSQDPASRSAGLPHTPGNRPCHRPPDLQGQTVRSQNMQQLHWATWLQAVSSSKTPFARWASTCSQQAP